MTLDIKHALHFGGCMIPTAVVAFFLQPLVLKTLFSEPGLLDALMVPYGYIGGFIYLFVYFAAAIIIWPKCKTKSWKELARIYALVVNAVIILFLFIYPHIPQWTIIDGEKIRIKVDALAWVFTLGSTIVAALLSIFPIRLCCYLFKRKMDKTAVTLC